MSSLLTTLGLTFPSPSQSTPSYASAFLIFNFLWAYALLSTRGIKLFYGLDHNVSPREDVSKYCERAAKEGKISQRTLGRIKRKEGAHANAVEGYSAFVGAVLFGIVTKVPVTTVNACCASYTIARVAHGIAYIMIEDHKLSYLRSLLWWFGNFCCLTLLWKGGNILNGL